MGWHWTLDAFNSSLDFASCSEQKRSPDLGQTSGEVYATHSQKLRDDMHLHT